MIKVYFDWNVISQMKNGGHHNLRDIVFQNDAFFIPFSTSHISDILSSFKDTEEQRELIQSDLDFITQLTDNKCLFNNGGDIVLDYYSPNELFQQSVEEKDTFKDISLDGLGKIFEDNELTKGLGQVYVNLLKSMPLGQEFRAAIEDPATAEQMEKMFPGLKDNPTMEGFFKSFSEMYCGLNEEEKYKDLRQLVQSGLGINRDKIFDIKNPYELIDSKYALLGSQSTYGVENDKNAPKWFNDISNEYIRLDMHGYQEDKVNVKKGRKETFKNTTEDAFHCAFASMCDFYIINDNKSYKKTRQVYEKLGVNTLVLKPDEFVEYYKNFLDLKGKTLNLSIPFEVIRSGEYVESKLDGAILRTYYLPYFLFDFFNKILVLIPDDKEHL